ncbi:MAG: hypothetical protein J7K53_10135 [Bacteroidales bacterium]|nr:hypothetical protein [Bacteroidales bacterium]
MKKSIITFLILGLTLVSFSQTDCNCEQALIQLIERVESGYPGFNEKTKDTTIYRDFKDNSIIESQDANSSDCSVLLKKYLSYFKDPHMRLIITDEGQVEKNEKKSDSKVNISRNEFYKHISKSKDELEGVWKSSSFPKAGIIKVNDRYQGFFMKADTTKWNPNDVMFKLMANGKAEIIAPDNSIIKENYELFDGSILLFKNYNIVMIKEQPSPKLSEEEIKLKLDKIDGFYYTKVSDKTSLLCITSFEDQYVERIEKMVLDNQQAIENSENLIIDVRNNLGGTYDAYDEILPYIITNNIRGVGQEFLVTQELIDGVEDWFDDEEGKKKARRWISMFEGNIGKFVNTDTADIHINKIEIAKQSPKQIVILANKRTASSGEAFVLEAKQSKKVKILGTPTYGAIDYASPCLFDFGCKDYKLMMPTWRDRRLPDYPIDNIGVQPDIYLDKSVKDWIQFAVDYLEN